MILLIYIVGACIYAYALIALVFLTTPGAEITLSHFLAFMAVVIFWPISLLIQVGMLVIYLLQSRRWPR